MRRKTTFTPSCLPDVFRRLLLEDTHTDSTLILTLKTDYTLVVIKHSISGIFYRQTYSQNLCLWKFHRIWVFIWLSQQPLNDCIYLTAGKVDDHQHHGISLDARRLWNKVVHDTHPPLSEPLSQTFPTRTQKSGIKGRGRRKRVKMSFSQCHMYDRRRMQQIPITSPMMIESLHRRDLIMDTRLLIPGIVPILCWEEEGKQERN